jgi:signal transduction histidine kinase
LKYAIATCITIDIVSTGNNKYKVSITDDGIGFDISGVDTSIKNGLENMKYRVRDIDCTLDIVTAMNKGTKVMITKK